MHFSLRMLNANVKVQVKLIRINPLMQTSAWVY
jgi:hypothetical protein